MDITNMHIDDILKKVKRIHFIGIGGAGMCPLAEILIQLGYNVSGSDNNDTETFRRIEKEGAKVYLGQVKENITDDVELVIYTNAILKGNEELEYAKANFPCFERAELLGAMSVFSLIVSAFAALTVKPQLLQCLPKFFLMPVLTQVLLSAVSFLLLMLTADSATAKILFANRVSSIIHFFI